MPTEFLWSGFNHAILQNVIYALPGKKVNIHSQAVVQISLTTTTTDFADLSTSTTGVETGAMFIRCTTGNTVVAVKSL